MLAGYNDTTEDNQETTEPEANVDDKNDGRQETEKVGRRVSFQLDNLPPATSTYLRKGRRSDQTAEKNLILNVNCLTLLF